MNRHFEYGVRDLDVWWIADRDLVATLEATPAMIIEQTHELELGAIRRLPSPPDRPVFEADAGEQRVHVTAFRCTPLRMEVVAIHVGPANEPREPILAALASVRCP